MSETQLISSRIVCAAVKQGDLVITGARHWDKGMRVLYERVSACTATTLWSSWEQGFIDQHNTFHNRNDAYWVAIAADQIRRPEACGGLPETPELFSEALY